MPTPSYKGNLKKWTGIYFGPTRGRAIPKNHRRACLCKDAADYRTDCCEGALLGQGIGQTQVAAVMRGAFSDGFSDGFDIDKQLT
jgi:hypothetical protein